MKAIILCGGGGSKFFPYNYRWQKGCIPIGNEANIKRIVKQLRKANINDISVLVDYHEHQVRYELRNEKSIQIIKTQSNSLHTDIANQFNDEPVLIYYGDIYMSDCDLKILITQHQQHGNVILCQQSDAYTRVNDYIGAFVDNH